MTDHIYKIEELVGSSAESLEAAIRHAIEHAAGAHKKLRWFEVTQTRGQIAEGKIAHWQVTVRVGYNAEGG
jgi:flavin-binding protein dodecin